MTRFLPAIVLALLSAFSFTANAQNTHISEIQKYLLEKNPDLKQSDIQNLVITNEFESVKGNLTHLYVSQAVNGIRISNSSLSATFDREGRLRFLAGIPFQNLSPTASSPSISLEQAISNQLVFEIPNLTITISGMETNKADIVLTG